MFNFDDANKVGKEAVDTMLKSYSAMSSGMQTIAAETADYSKKSVEHGASTFEKLAGAKSLEKVFEIQTDYAKSSYEAFVQQATKISEIYADLAKDVYKPFEKTASKVAN
jgi:phasin family protein